MGFTELVKDMVRDVTTSQVRFSRAERMKRLQSRQQQQAQVEQQWTTARDPTRFNGRVTPRLSAQSPARQRQAERREQMAAQRAAEAARAEEEYAAAQGITERQSGTSQWHADHAEYEPSTFRSSGHDMQRTWPSAHYIGDSAGSIGRRYAPQHEKPSRAVAGNPASFLWSPEQPSMETEAYQKKLLRPGRTQHLERQIGFGRPLVPLSSLAKKAQSEEDIATAQVSPTKLDQRRSRVKLRRRRRQQQQHPRRSASSMAALPSTRGKFLPARDSAWRDYDGGAHVLVREDRQLATVWYAQDESRRFIKGNVVKGALPPVQRTGLSLRANT